ncbi:MAG: leucyl aminopeptidase [Anaerolineae bacterium]|nr:leucyl aminopeptidase [Anaerolineae bacterium]
MEVKIQADNIATFSADTLIVNLFAGVKMPGGATGAVDRALDGAISDLIAAGDLDGSANQIRVLYPRGAIAAQRVIIVGLGSQDEFNLTVIRNAAAHAAKAARKHKAEHVATIVHGAGIGGIDTTAAAEATVEGTLLGLYRYAKPLRRPKTDHEIATITVVELFADKLDAIRDGVRTAQAIADGVILTRDLVKQPANIVSPQYLAGIAQQIADEYDIDITVGGRKWMRKHKMGALLAVAQGAGQKPRFIVLDYNSHLDTPPLVLVGKGITFDSGGITIKPGANMGAMKGDMAAAAAVLGVAKIIAELQLPLRVVTIVASAENMPDAKAYHPGDVITASNGTTIEIISTDAEGRLVLADALVYAQRYNPELVIDMATLTGTIGRAMGTGISAGVFSNDDAIWQQLEAAGAAAHERVWRFPLWKEYRERIKSSFADMKNSGGAFNGLGTSAVFLQEFTDYPWAHIDIANMSYTTTDQAYESAYGTGFGVRLLVAFLRNRTQQA